MNHNRRKFTPTADMPRPFARNQTKYECGKGRTIRYTLKNVPQPDGSTADMTLRDFKRMREAVKRSAHDMRKASKKENA